MTDHSIFPLKFEFWTKKDFVFFYIIIPAVLTFMFLLPENIKYYFILIASNPTILSMFFSNYMHTSLSHFLGNLFSYFIIIFLLFNLEINKKIFYISSILIFLILPFVSSILLVYRFPALPPSLGFSAIVASFNGYLVYSVFNYIKKFYYQQTNIRFVWLILMINVIFAANNLGTPAFFQVIVISLSIILIFLNRAAIKEIFEQTILKFKNLISQKFKLFMYNTILFSIVIVFIFSLPSLIPSEIKNGNSIINIFSHYVGYLFGLFIPLIMTSIKDT